MDATAARTFDGRRRPGITGYVLAGLIGVAAVAGSLAILLSMILPLGSELRQMVVPGEHEFDLRPGSYTVFHETNSVVDGRVFGPADISGLVVRILDPNGRRVPVDALASSGTYSFGSREGRSILGARLSKPGRYRIVAGYPDRPDGPQAVLAFGPSIASTILPALLWTLLVGFGGIATAITVAILTYVRRSRFDDAAAATLNAGSGASRS